MVKVFPAKLLGPSYFKEILGPFKNIKLLACGGVNPSNIAEYAQCGASAFAFGASGFRNEWLKNKDYSSIGRSIKDLILNIPTTIKTQ